jgi:hypothetical protein
LPQAAADKHRVASSRSDARIKVIGLMVLNSTAVFYVASCRHLETTGSARANMQTFIHVALSGTSRLFQLQCCQDLVATCYLHRFATSLSGMEPHGTDHGKGFVVMESALFEADDQSFYSASPARPDAGSNASFGNGSKGEFVNPLFLDVGPVHDDVFATLKQLEVCC